MSHPFLAAPAALLALAVTACGASQQAASSTTLPSAAPPATGDASSAPTVPGRSPAGSPSAAASSTGAKGVTKLLVFVVENHSLTQMRDQMPFTNALATQFGYADHYDAIMHPSLPNYLAIAGGDTFGVGDDDSPAAHPLTGGSVFGAAVHSGSSARLYAEAMQLPCQPDPAGDYAVKHNPWAYFSDEAALCQQDDVPLTQLSDDVIQGHLPAVGMVIPDLCHDAHDCSLSDADTWLRTYVGSTMSGPDWRSGRLAIVITADEDDRAHGNRILTVVAHPAVHNAVVSTPLDHYSLSRAYAEVAGVPPLRRAASAADLLQAFGLTPG